MSHRPATSVRRALLALVPPLACCLGFWTSAPAFGGGIEVINQSARGAGQAEAYSAQADDPSAVYYNPAGLTQLRGSNFSAGAYAIFPEWRFRGPAGSESMYLPSVLPHLYAESDFGLQRWRFGIGINNTFGLQETWGDQGPLRTLVDKVRLSVLTVSPTVAYAVNDNLSLGLAFNVYDGDLTLRRSAVLGAPPTPQGFFGVKGRDIAFGVTPGVLWKIDPRNTVGAFYRSPFSLGLEGSARLTAPGLPKIGPSPSRTDIQFPQSAGIAYAVRPVKPLKLEADVVWTNWNSFDKVLLESPDPHFNGMTIPSSWKDTFSYKFGVEYNLNDRWTVRGGYAFGQNAVPQSTFSPLVPDSNYHLFSVGLGYTTPGFDVDFAYQYIYRETRHIVGAAGNSLVNGTWDNQMNNFMVTATWKF